MKIKRIPLNIVFAFLFLLCFIGTLSYKTYVYFSSEKYTGKIVDFVEDVSYIYPIIEFEKNKTKVWIEDEKWFYMLHENHSKLREKELNKEVVILKHSVFNTYEYVTFFNFWFTVYDFIIWFCILFFGVFFIELLQSFFYGKH